MSIVHCQLDPRLNLAAMANRQRRDAHHCGVFGRRAEFAPPVGGAYAGLRVLLRKVRQGIRSYAHLERARSRREDHLPEMPQPQGAPDGGGIQSGDFEKELSQSDHENRVAIMKTYVLVAAFVLLQGLLFAEEKDFPYPCGQEAKFEVKIRTEGQSSLPSIPEGKSLLIVVRDGGGLYNLGFAINGKWVGATHKSKTNHFFLILNPGEYRFCSTGSLGRSHLLPGFLKLNVEPNKTYYVEQQFMTQVLQKDRVRLQLLDEEQGTQILLRGKLATMVKPIPEVTTEGE